MNLFSAHNYSATSPKQHSLGKIISSMRACCSREDKLKAEFYSGKNHAVVRRRLLLKREPLWRGCTVYVYNKEARGFQLSNEFILLHLVFILCQCLQSWLYFVLMPLSILLRTSAKTDFQTTYKQMRLFRTYKKY